MKEKHPLPPYVVFSAVIAALSAFLFGYHTAIISGAVLFIAKEFALTGFQQEFLISSTLIGCVFGALSGGISDYLGRKRTLIYDVFLYLIATFLLFDAQSYGVLITGRLIVGFAIGIASVTVPLYISEISPSESRGRLVSLNQLLITVGVLISYWIAYLYAAEGNWRTMFSFAMIPALVQLFCLLFIPETPAWLISKGRSKQAEKALRQLKMASPNAHLAEQEKSQNKPIKKKFKALWSPSVRAPFLIGVGISVFQQITGINTVIYYAPRIFQMAGFKSAESAILATVWVGVVNVVMTIVGLWLVDRLGRRVLVLTGVGGMALSLAALGGSFIFQSGDGALTVIALLAYIGFFAPGLGIVAWVLISEIYPLGIRGRAMSVATFFNWVSNYIVSLTFLTLVQLLTIGGTYWLFTLICVVCFIFIWKKVPETRGKTFEQIQAFWQK